MKYKVTVLKSLLSLKNFNLHFKRNLLKFITIICTQNKIYVNEKILHWNTNKQVYDCTCYLYASLCWIPWPYPGSRLLTSTKICFHADLWKYQILAVPSLEPLRNLINHKIKWRKKKNSKNQIHLYIISFYQYASPYYMNVFLEVWDGGQNP